MSPALVTRHASVEDAPALAAFAAKAFSDTYRDLHEPWEITSYVAESFNPQSVAEVLRDPACTTILAEVGSRLAGYAVVQAAEPPGCVTGPSPMEVARFYLGEEFLGQGYGAQLMRAVHAEARRLGARTLWLGVYDRNVRAVRFYERMGFTKVGGKEFLIAGQIYIDPIYSAPVEGGVGSQ